MDPVNQYIANITRRYFFERGSHFLGTAALASLMGSRASNAFGAEATNAIDKTAVGKIPPELLKNIGHDAALSATHFPPKVKNVIYLHMVGAPSQLDLFDYKPKMDAMYDKDLPDSIRQGQRITAMTADQARFPIAPTKYKFKQYGESGAWFSEMLPYCSQMADDLCFIKSMHTEAINHEPALNLFQTGNQVAGRPCIGSWISYGLGALNQNLPTFVVMVAKSTNRQQTQAISARMWASGFLPGRHAGVSFRSAGDPILFLKNPPGVPDDVRLKTIESLNKLNKIALEKGGDPETLVRIQQYEMTGRMQSSVPELTDLSKETEATLKMYGDDVKTSGTFANTALMARRMVERGVRFVQVYHNNWDHHFDVNTRLPSSCKDADQGSWALVQDLKQRGMLEDTLVIWGGEFGRTIYSQGTLSKTNYGRDHHPRCFTLWMAGGGVKPGFTLGETDDFSYNITKDPVHIRDFHATMLYQLGIDHEQFTYRFNGLDNKLTGVEKAKVVKEIFVKA